MPSLRAYYSILSHAAPALYSVDLAARCELEWWQGRRENVAPEVYGLSIAKVASLVYGVEGETVERSGILRAEAMAFRDARRRTITNEDWSSIEGMLQRSYALLLKAIEESGAVSAHT
ncbi:MULTISPECIES: hypothetical protein [unclassified Sinorhizobium]|uniref:hypothetical protein n=1 Tax=unclassified Sinorhizobium TaxID=2613772 RepID=UPI003525C1FB